MGGKGGAADAGDALALGVASPRGNEGTWLAFVKRGQPLSEGREGLMMFVMRLPLAWLALAEGKKGPITLVMRG